MWKCECVCFCVSEIKSDDESESVCESVSVSESEDNGEGKGACERGGEHTAEVVLLFGLRLSLHLFTLSLNKAYAPFGQ